MCSIETHFLSYKPHFIRWSNCQNDAAFTAQSPCCPAICSYAGVQAASRLQGSTSVPISRTTAHGNKKARRPHDLRAANSWSRGQDLNLRPPGYEPGELPDCSTPQCLVHLWCKKIYYDVRSFNSSRILIVSAFPHFREFRHADDQVGRRSAGRRRI